ncbi:uncharacterized protein CANTADRAFT_41729, partial [Suhomyces tanzawaensis NRRL Y-17324]
EDCLICANKIRYAALTPCNHTTCHTCTFRQRALYDKKQCLICRSENEKVVFTEQLEKNYGDFVAKDFVDFDSKRSIEFTQNYVYTDTMDLLSNKCAICHERFDNFKGLGEHVKASHGKFHCVICSKFKKAFVSELSLYTHKGLQKHQSEGDERGFTGHPECKHCHGKRFYSIDELNIHIREKHERCFICDQYNPKTADYFKNYDTLYNHFKRDHYVCSMPLCVEKRFVVFREDLDLTAHMLKEHGGLGTAGSSRVVIGSNSRHFQSQLSTFQESNTRRFLERNDESEDHNSIETKRKRFEERAKHYLNYDTAKFKEFTSLNSGFRAKKFNARELFEFYGKLFEGQTEQELRLLFSEFIEFFPENSDLHKDLSPVVKELSLKADNEQFPMLGKGSTPAAATWLRNGNKAKSQADKFPALSKPKKASSVPSTPPIRYTTVIKKTPVKKVVVNTSLASSGYVPDYLNNMSKPSTPVLGSRSRPLAGSRNGSSSSLEASKFPVLEKKSTKKVIPRVKQYDIADPDQWGRVPEPPTVPVDTGIEITDKRQQKLKKK